MEKQACKTSALLIIGNEILSGRTQDKNVQYIAEKMAGHGVPLSEVRVIADIEDVIVQSLNDLRALYDFVFTTGGIGPTHDDITAASVAKAFGVSFGRHHAAYKVLENYYGDALTDARASMAEMPIFDGLKLIDNPVSGAPGFNIGNVFVMAGVPKIMQAMFDNVLDMIESGAPVISVTVMVERPESEIAHILSFVQASFSSVDIGSYPQFKQGEGWGVSVVLRCVDGEVLKAAQRALEEAFVNDGIDIRYL
ncbi:MAG: competence/damage-inducible protein A [Bdellovibrionales bacterium]